jgi:CheY-like chemotaxis protein
VAVVGNQISRLSPRRSHQRDESHPDGSGQATEVIIMDIGLSEMGYFEALEEIKTVASAPQIVVLTNYEEEEVQCTLATANEASIYFLWKNNMLTELEPILAAWLLPRQNGVTSKFAVALPGMG